MNRWFLLGKIEINVLFLLGNFKMKHYTFFMLEYTERHIDKALLEWKNSPKRKPLMLRGVRQCGKTSAVRHLAESFRNYVELNLEKQNELCSVFDGDFDVKRIITRLELAFSQKITAGETLIFIDEIQECPRAITALRYFYEDMPDLHVIAAGSLLEFVLNQDDSKEAVDFPVGRVRSLFMYPFSFLEFLRAVGDQILIDYLENLHIFEEKNEAHEKLLARYKEFLIVGGMPEAVTEYAETGSLFASQAVHRDILLNFKDDFSKYKSKVPPDMIERVFDFAIHNVCNQVKSTTAIRGVSAYYFDECITLLRRAGLVVPVKASSCDKIPIGAGGKDANKKLLFFDTGLYLTENQLDTAGLFAAKAFDEMNKGAVVEMSVGLEMIKSSLPASTNELYYWYQSGANAEVDYVIQKGANIVPLEVKASGKGAMQSMRSYLHRFPAVPYGIRVSLEDFCEYDDIKVFPVYAAKQLVEWR